MLPQVKCRKLQTWRLAGQRLLEERDGHNWGGGFENAVVVKKGQLKKTSHSRRKVQTALLTYKSD